jgi:hypothetical protein
LGALSSWILSSIKHSIIIYTPLTINARCIIWFLVPSSTQLILDKPYKSAHIVIKLLDQGWLETPQTINNSLIIINNKFISSISPTKPSDIILASLARLTTIRLITTLINLYPSSL